MEYFSFYQRYFPLLKATSLKTNVVCPFHDDKDPSLSLDIKAGLWYCHGCKEGGDIFSFYMKYHNCSFSKAKNDILGNEQFEILTETEVNVAHKRLIESKTLQKLLLIKRGWSLDTIEKYKLGWGEERVTIPIYNKNKELINIRRYDILHKTKEKFKGVKGYNQIHLYPEEALDKELIVLCAGEPDTLLARQYGINAVTFTGAEGVFAQELVPKFKDKIVYVVYDVDEHGKKASFIIANRLAQYASEVYVIELPEKILPEKGDFTDLVFYCIDNGKDLSDLWNPCIELAKKIEQAKNQGDIQYQEINFYDAVKNEYFNKDIQYNAIAIGKNISPYFAPKKVRIKCSFTRGESCKSCILFITGGEHEVNITEEQSLELIKCSRAEQKSKLQGIIGIHKCNQFEMDMDTRTIEEIFVSPVIDTEKIDRQFLLRKVYTESHNLKLNKTYKFFGKTISDPKTQEATNLFTKSVPELSNLDTFKLTSFDKDALKIFQPKENTAKSIKEKIDAICKDLTFNIPEVIVGREALIFSYDLVFHSVLRFKFAGSVVSKGAVELLVLGDTRTGKTKTATKLCHHYKSGEYVTLEASTLPGLIGGMSKVGTELTFAWGLLPVNDGRLVILDEVNGLDVNSISNLSSVRDNGIAERTIVGSTRKTSARVRLIWISNPRAVNKNIDDYTSGIEAIKELIGRAEDISRLDFAIIVSKRDVGLEKINTKRWEKVEHVFTSSLCSKLLTWAWSRKEKDVAFKPEAEKKIFDYAVQMSNKYSDSVPLVQGSVQRIKLAKLSVALACRLFSTEDGEKVIVRPEHVDYIHMFLNQVYDSQFFGYGNYSVMKKEQHKMSDIDQVKRFILSIEKPNVFITKCLNANSIIFDDLIDFANISKTQAKQFRRLLVTNNCLYRSKSYYKKTPEFIALLKQLSEKTRKVENE